RREPAHAVNVPQDQVPAELVAELERALQVDGRPDTPVGEGRARAGLGRGLHAEPALPPLNGGQADTRTRDRGAGRERAGVVMRLDVVAGAAARQHRAYPAEIRDDAREHGAVT